MLFKTYMLFKSSAAKIAAKYFFVCFGFGAQVCHKAWPTSEQIATRTGITSFKFSGIWTDQGMSPLLELLFNDWNDIFFVAHGLLN